MKISKILKDELNARKRKNKRYSLRSFARFLNMDSTALSRIINEERLPTLKTSIKILKALNIPASGDLSKLQTNSKEAKSKHKALLQDSFERETFDSVFGARHIYVLTSLRINKLPSSLLRAKLSQECGIDEVEFQKIIQDLKSVGAIIEEGSKIKVVYKNKSTVPLPFTSEKRKTLQQEFLTSACGAINKFSIEERDNSTLTVAIDKQDLEKIRKILRDTHIKINRIAENKKSRDAVYNICLAAYPILK